MSTCPRCRRHYREPEGEEGDHACPSCGIGPGDELDEDEEDDSLTPMTHEFCCNCDDETGRAGRADDSIYRTLIRDWNYIRGTRYAGDEVGPLCEACCEKMTSNGYFQNEDDDEDEDQHAREDDEAEREDADDTDVYD